jgi:hypothetical protein
MLCCEVYTAFLVALAVNVAFSYDEFDDEIERRSFGGKFYGTGSQGKGGYSYNWAGNSVRDVDDVDFDHEIVKRAGNFLKVNLGIRCIFFI